VLHRKENDAIIMHKKESDYMELFTIDEAAKILKVSRRTVYEWVRTGKLDAVKAGSLWRIPHGAINKFLEKPKK
jgi:excisionase family DNA binding protein